MNRMVIYVDRKGEWRWRLIAKNGRIVADSGEGYSSKQKVKIAVKRLPDIIRLSSTEGD